MYNSHELLKEPQDSAQLWRYMDLAKFLSLLHTKALHLAALRTFEDPFEGHPPRCVVTPLTDEPPGLTEEMRAERLAVIENNLDFFKNSRHLLFASCWHMNEKESAGMWAQYIRSGEGIAVQTTFGRLKESIATENVSVFGAVVQYVDFDLHIPEGFNVVTWAALKRSSYSHENEFRLLAVQADGARGILLPVSLDKLIERVFVAPTTPDWLLSSINSLLALYGIGKEAVRSELLDSPTYLVVPEWAQ